MHWIDPRSLPPLKGTVAQFVMNRDGELDGLVLVSEAGTPQLVHFPTHMSGAVEAAIKVGDELRVHGVRPRGGAVLAAISLVTADGHQILDEGPDAPHAESQPSPEGTVIDDQKVGGRVHLSLFGPKGELRGAILEDGTVIRVGKKEAQAFAALLAPGIVLAARGAAIDCPLGTMLDAHELGADEHSLQPVKKHKPEKPKGKNCDEHGEHEERLFGPMEAAEIANAEGYALIGDLRPHKKHFEALATKGDTKFEIHVHRDGRVEAKRELGMHDQRRGALPQSADASASETR